MQQQELFEIERKFDYKLGSKKQIPVEVSFRNIVPEIKDTTYLTHSVYYYPAKFIPQVIRFCIKEFTIENDWIIDPFAGSGSVGLESFLTKRNSVLLDLNYLLKFIIPIKIYKGKADFTESELFKYISTIQKEKETFIPDYKNIRYWYPDEIFEVLSRYWSGLHKLNDSIYKWIIQAALVRISKQFSLAEHRTPKLFKSKFKKKFISDLLKINWKKELDNKLISFSRKYYESVRQLIALTKNFDYDVKYFAGVDSSKFKLEENIKFDALITSPPYLQAQEYLRTSKLDLFWLGCSENKIKELSRLEIPYRKAERLIETETLEKVRNQLKNKNLINLLNSYFDHTIAALENNIKSIKDNGKICIFIGNPLIDGIEIETWRILTEYFTNRGLDFEIVFDDKIKTRQLFGSRKNKNPNGMQSEFLLVLSKKYKKDRTEL